MPPCRLIRPKVGRSALIPLRDEGDVIEPCVSVPIEKPTSPAAVAEPGPAEEPPEPAVGFHGFLVLPRNHPEPWAMLPVASFARSTAPAFSRRRTSSEV